MQWFEENHFPLQIVKKMGNVGIFGPNVSQKYGGGGMDHISYGLIMQELERGDSGMRSTASVQSSLVMYPIESYGSEKQKNKFLPKLASGEMLGCFGLTEPDYGSNPGGMITKIDVTVLIASTVVRSSKNGYASGTAYSTCKGSQAFEAGLSTQQNKRCTTQNHQMVNLQLA